MKFGKMEIVNCLSAFYGKSRFLEISTATTGCMFADVDLAFLSTAHRLAYNLPSGFQDGAPIEFRSSTLNIDGCVAELERRGARYDIILVDPYHDYERSYRDIELAFRLLSAGGIMVIHDCLPPSGGNLISPTYVPGDWCGVTFIAYIDFLMKENADFVTIDCDYGCGIVRHQTERKPDPLSSLRDAWSAARGDGERALRFVSEHKEALCNAITPYEFLTQLFSEGAKIRNDLDETRNSTCWRMTSPIRRLADAIGRKKTADAVQLSHHA